MVEFNFQFKNGKKIQLTEEQTQIIIELYQKGTSLVDLCQITHIKAPQTIRKILRDNGVEIKGFRYKYPLKEDYFENINTPDKAYWLGVLYADGAIIQKGYSIRLGLIDKEHIEKFKITLGAINHKIGEIEDTRFFSVCKNFYVSIRSQKMFWDLCHWGCVPNKSLVLKKIPEIEENLISHFIRGYFDGDGSIHKTLNQWRISFTGTQDFLKDIQKHLKVSTKIVQGPNNAKDFVFQVMGKYQLKRVLDYLYLNSNENNRLNRKFKKYSTFLKETGASLSNL